MLNKMAFALCLAFLAAAGLRAQTGDAVFAGKIKGYAGKDTLFCYFGAVNEGYDTVAIRKDGTFSLAKPMKKEGTVMVFWEGRNARKHDALNVVLAPGKTLHVEINPRQAAPDSVVLEAEFSGDNADKSEYVNLAYYYSNRSAELADVTLARLPDFKTCLAYVEERMQRLENVLGRVDDEDFVAREQKNMGSRRSSYYFSYALAKEKAGGKVEDDADFNAFVRSIDMNDTANVADICRYLGWYYVAHPGLYAPLSAEAAQLKYLKELTGNQDVRNRVANNFMMGQIFLMQFGLDPTSPEMKGFLEQYLDVATDSTYALFVKTQLDIIKRNEPGQPAFDFPVRTTDGKEVGFKSLVGGGAVTYIDFWATWCGPCCKEIPFLEKLVEHYKGNDKVRFISVSIDTNTEAWKKKVAADKPAWAQYIIPQADKSEGVKYYNITAIPRFMVFDKEGKLYRSSASRPSDEDTKALIESLTR